MKYLKIVVLLSALLSSCDKEQPVVTSIRLDRSELVLTVGEEYQFVVSHKVSEALEPNYTWSLSDDKVASISNKGLLTTLKAGEVVIFVTTNDVLDSNGKPFTASCKVKVNPVLASGIKFAKDTFSVRIGDILQLSYSFIPENATCQNVVWSSSDNNISTISQSGSVKGINIGETVITIQSEKDENVKDSCIVNVNERHLDGIALDRTEITNVIAGLKETLSVIYIPENATNKNVKWESSNTKIAVVDSKGVVSLLTSGSCKITVTSEDGGHTASCLIKVPHISVDGIIFQQEKYEIGVGQSFSLKDQVSVLPFYATNKNFTLGSLSGANVASINSQGIVIGLEEGIAVFYAKTDEKGYETSCLVNVVNPIIAALDVSISLSGWANIGGYLTANYQCTVLNRNNKPIKIRAFRIMASDGRGEDVLEMSRIVNANSSAVFSGHFASIYDPYYLLFFEHEEICCYVKRVNKTN